MYMCRNLTGRPEELKTLALPGELGLYECDSTEAGRPCYQKFVERCSAILGPWRAAEARKTVGKVFTSLFILLGMGVLGACSTAQHSTAQHSTVYMHAWMDVLTPLSSTLLNLFDQRTQFIHICIHD